MRQNDNLHPTVAAVCTQKRLRTPRVSAIALCHAQSKLFTGVPPYALIDYPLFTAARKKNWKVKEINGP
jgi:hypothetical protein